MGMKKENGGIKSSVAVLRRIGLYYHIGVEYMPLSKT